ncbi:MAG: hypothetical protein JXB60_02385 [Candidatus Cloacimonetes bacterium]|nr:hypothetical protein [Candidatus Cloacimonadota bacterium]
MKDFTLSVYAELLSCLINRGFRLLPVREFLKSDLPDTVGVRHDVDRNPGSAWRMAKLEKEAGLTSTYYFKAGKRVFQPGIISAVARLGHEIGYHYEDLSITKGDFEKAIALFQVNLDKFRRIYPVKTISAHGSPLSKWDNRKIWEYYSLNDFSLEMDVSAIKDNLTFYITDAGRSWNDKGVNLRDKVDRISGPEIPCTGKIIDMINKKEISGRILFNIHPEHWADGMLAWYRISIWRGLKNPVKRLFLKTI